MYLARKCGLYEISSKNTTRCWKLCSTSFCVKDFLLPNYKDILLKSAFCIKSAQRIQLAVENCVSLHFKLKSSFLRNFKDILQKNAFCIKSAERTQLGVENCLTSFYVKIFLLNFLLPNDKDILLKTAFWIKSAQRIQLAVENSLSLQFVSKTHFFQIIRISC